MTTGTTLDAATARFITDVRDGLGRTGQKELPSKYLYDAIGSALFDVITLLPEYGLGRAGTRLLERNVQDLVRRLSSPLLVAELGSGSGKKTGVILEALSHRHVTTYCPIDISRAALDQAERELERWDSVSILGLEREYLDGLSEAAERRRKGQEMLVLFLGGTIGNFDRPAAERFLNQVRRRMVSGDRLLLSTDLVKPEPQLLLAYDDPIGVTAAFNLNLLARINRELGGDFSLAGFRHEVRYDHPMRRVEMHLRSVEPQTVHVREANLTVTFRPGETIWTESSHKFSTEEVRDLAQRAGFRCETQWIDEQWPFAQNLLGVD